MSKELDKPSGIVRTNSWRGLRRHTDARIGLGRAGISQPTHVQLQFQLDHAKARDAIHIPLDDAQLVNELEQSGLTCVTCMSQAKDRTTYLQRPDLGRQLDRESVEKLEQWKRQHNGAIQATIVVADGLSTTAIQLHAAKLTQQLVKGLSNEGWTVGPICIVKQGRVAVGDEVGEILNSEVLVLLVGERPGLSSPDSVGIYFTYQPRLGLTDANRNCLSNIRPAGMSFGQATHRLMWLVREARRRGLSGVELKDESDQSQQLEPGAIDPALK